MHEMNSILNQEFDSSNEDFIDQLLLSMPPTWPELTEVIGEEMQFPVGGGGCGNNCSEVDNSVQALYNVLAGTMQSGQVSNPAAQHLHIPQAGPMQTQSFGGGDGGAKPRQRVRAKRGQATDPHSIAERLRRERIAERMKSLQELVPNSNKTDKASMLEEIIAYVKFLQLQVKVLSMSKMGRTCVVASLVVDLASEQTSNPGGVGTERPANNDNAKVTESRVVKLMEEDMGSAMQYLRGKGLCLMPISLATAIAPLTQANMNNDDDEKI